MNMTSKTKTIKRGRPSEVTPYLEIIRSTPKGDTALVGNLSRDGHFLSHQAASYRAKTITTALKTAKVNVVRQEDGFFYLLLAGRAKQA
jgi:hypothetical protein